MKNQRIYLQELARRWNKSNDEVLDLAIKGELTLWIELNNVFQEKQGGKKKKKASEPKLRQTVEMQPLPEVLTQIQGRSERVLIISELVGMNRKGKRIALTNAVGDEWGPISMLGLRPQNLFADWEDVLAYEKQHDLTPAASIDNEPLREPVAIDEPIDEPEERASAEHEPEKQANLPQHPCFACELHIALACWQALFAEADAADDVAKDDIFAWLEEHYPDLSQTAQRRIALVVSPARTC
ncbi:MAG: hypothetical protein ACOX5Z_00755 [Desulfobulbus sp.]